MLDNYNRQINYLRISVTDRCNLRCHYCMPEDGVQLFTHEEIIKFEEIIEIVKYSITIGINKFRLTGGEPLLRRNVVELVKMISDIKGVDEVAMTTNAQLLGQYAQSLFDNGLKRVNISLDTVDEQKYLLTTRGGNLLKTLEGIEAARKAGLNPIKINCVVAHNSDEVDALAVKAYCQKNNLEVRFIKQMTLSKGEFWEIDGGTGGNCKNCNRLRLTSNGKLKPCLFSDLEFDIRTLGIPLAFKKALDAKPERGSINNNNQFNNIGG